MIKKSTSILLITFITYLISGCNSQPGGGNTGGNNSSSPSASSSSAPSSINHPYLWADTLKTETKAIIIYMGSACNLQSYALENINQTFVADNTIQTKAQGSVNLWDLEFTNGWTTKIFVYIDATADYGVFPAWVKPGGLLTINYSNMSTTNGVTASGIERFDRVYMPADQDACNPTTLQSVLEFVKTNYNLQSNNVSLIMWGHGDGIWPINGGITGMRNSSKVDYEKLALEIMLDLTPFTFTSCSMNPNSENKPNTSHLNTYASHAFGSVLYNDNTQMTLYDFQIVQAIKNTFGGMGTIGFDACYSGNIEDMYTFAAVQGFVGHIIGSPKPEADIGWYYTKYLNGAQDAYSASNTGVSLDEWINEGALTTNSLYSIPGYLNEYYNWFTGQPADIAFFITNMRKYIISNINNGGANTDPTTHYVRLYDILNDLQNFDSSLSSYFSTYMTDCSGSGENATNMGIWLPLFPKQYYNSYVQTWHNATNIQLFHDNPQIADWFTNAKWGQTQNSVYQFTPQFNPGYYNWAALSSDAGTTATISGSYRAYIIDQRSENQTIASAIDISPTIYSQTNVAFLCGEGQIDYYKLNVQTSGWVHLRLSFATPLSTSQVAVSNVSLMDSSQNVLQNYPQLSGVFTLASSTGTALSTVAQASGTIPVSTSISEYYNMPYIEINTNLSAGVYYIQVCAQDLMQSYYGPIDAPYLIYALPLGGESPAAVLQ